MPRRRLADSPPPGNGFTTTHAEEETTMRTVFATLMALAFALSASAALADEFSRTQEPFVMGAQIYAQGSGAFAPSAGLPTREDFVGQPMGIPRLGSGAGVSSPWIIYHLKDPGRFKFELQTPSHEYDPKMHQGL